MLRAGDLHFAELQGDWRLSYPLPARPSWVDDDDQVFARRRVHSGACGAHVGNAGPGKTSVAACDAFTDSANAAAPAASPSSSAPAPLEKYFLQRYMLFSKYDRGVKLDSEGWYSVTPEVLAAHMAERCRCDMIIDAFTGVGGNAIQFAYTCERVVAIDLDASRLELAKHNAAVYNVADRVEWIHADFFALAPLLRADVVFLSPPWGGPQYQLEESFDVVTMMGGLDGAEILRQSLRIAPPNVCYFLPKNTPTRRSLRHSRRRPACRSNWSAAVSTATSRASSPTLASSRMVKMMIRCRSVNDDTFISFTSL